MQYTCLGRSGMKVSRLCLGTYNFGTFTGETEARRIMDAAIDAEINFFDTANHYPDFTNCGLTEEYIGQWFAQGGSRREKVILATKVSQPMMDKNDGPNNDGGLSKYKIRRHVEGSLRRLQTDHIELYQMHHIDRHTPWEEIWEAFRVLMYQGKIGYAGSSNFAGWDLALAQAAAKECSCLGLVSEQHKYNLLCRLPELEVLPAARNLGIGVIAYSTLQGGVLGGKALNPEPKSRSEGARALAEEHRAKLTAFSQICRELGEDEANVAMAWVLAHPALNCVIIGPRTVAQLKGALRAAEIKLDGAVMTRLNGIFPGPGGEAPWAYAW